MNIVVGKSAGKNVHLDIKTLLRTHLLIWASTGGGKSYLIRRLAEQTFGKLPIIIVDREGEFPTLREKYGFVLVGPHGETPADPRSAKLVAERLLQARASAVCDLFELGVEARHEWVRNFYLALVNAPKTLWGPTIIILDEAHTFAPEKGQGDSIAYPAVTDFNGVARKRGFASVLATQRLSKLSKNATAEMYNQAAGPTAQQSDRDRAAYEMGIPKGADTREFSEALRTLEPGHFFFQGRAIAMERVLVAVGAVETSHGTETTGKHAAKVPPTPEEVKKLLPKLTDLPKQAEAEARTEAEYKRLVRDLERQIKTLQRAAPATITVPKEVRVADPQAIARATAPLRDLLSEAMKIIVKLEVEGKKVSAGEIQKKGAPHAGHGQMAASPVPTATIHRPKANSNGDLPQGEEATLKAIGRYAEGADRDQLSVLTGFKRSTRNTYISRLASRGYISVNGPLVVITEAGISALGDGYEQFPISGKELREYWLRGLPEGEKKILEILLRDNAYIAREALDAETGFARSSRNTYISRMLARRIVETQSGEVKAVDSLFG